MIVLWCGCRARRKGSGCLTVPPGLILRSVVEHGKGPGRVSASFEGMLFLKVLFALKATTWKINVKLQQLNPTRNWQNPYLV